MKKYLTTLVMIGVLPLTCAAADNLTDLYFSDMNNPKLNAQEKAAIAIANRWRASSAVGMKPVPGPVVR